MFQDFVRNVAKLALEHGTDVEALGDAAYPGGGTVAEKLTDNIAKIGENQSLRRAAVLEVERGRGRALRPQPGRSGPRQDRRAGRARERGSGRDAAGARQADRDARRGRAPAGARRATSSTPTLIERERAIAMEKAKESGKPQNIVEKMVEGGLAKFRKDNALLSQLFVMDNKTPVADVVAAAAKDAGAADRAARASSASSSARASRRSRKRLRRRSRRRCRHDEGRAGRLSSQLLLGSWQRGGCAIKAWPPLFASGGQSARMTRPRFNRILLKLSGEALMGQGQFGIDPDAVAGLAGEIAAAKAQGHELCLVVGGGNIFRGMAAAAKGFDRATADYMGMLATVMNALALQNALEKLGVDTRVQSAIPMASVSRALHPPPRAAAPGEGPDRPVRRRHRQSLFHDRHGGRAARRRDGLRRLVQGHQRRRRLHRRPEEGAATPSATTPSSFSKVLSDDLKVMDAAAVALCRDNNIPIVVFNIRQPGNLAEVLAGRGHRDDRPERGVRHDDQHRHRLTSSAACTARSRR